MSKFTELAVKLEEIKRQAKEAGLPFIFSLGDYSLEASGSTHHSVGVTVQDDIPHVMLDHVRDVILFTPIEVGTDKKSGPYFQELKDLLFRWHNSTHTDKLVERDGRYEWAE